MRKYTGWIYDRTAPTPEEFVEDLRFSFVDCRTATRWERLRLALAFFLTPFTVVLFGHSIAVTLKWYGPRS